jgi:integrase
MTKGQNTNRPKKGSHITVDPIRRMKDIQSISKLLSDHPRNHLLFVMGTNNGVRTGDLLKLKVSDVKGMKIGDTLAIKEGKTGKRNILVMNKSIYKSLQTYIEALNPMDDDALFASRKGRRSITVQCVNNRWSGFLGQGTGIHKWEVALG